MSLDNINLVALEIQINLFTFWFGMKSFGKD